RLPGPRAAEHGFEFFDEIGHVLEVPIDRGKTDESDLVDVAQRFHHFFADVPRGDFALEVLVEVDFDVGNDPFDRFLADRTLPARFVAAIAVFGPVEGDAGAVFFDDFQGRFFDFFIRCEPPFTLQTLPAATNDELLTPAGVDDFRLVVPAKWTHHERHSL